MARIGPGRARGSRTGRGRGQRRTSTWEISDSDTEGPTGAEADSEVAARARDPAEERRVAAEALRLLRPEQAVRRLMVHVDPGALGAECQGRGPSSCLSSEAWALEAPFNYWVLVPGPCGVRGTSIKAASWP